MNVKLLKHVRDMILRRPKQFDMDDWTASHIYNPKTQRAVKPSHCGTAACIGGWAIVLAEKKQPVWLRQQRAKSGFSFSGTCDKANAVLDLNSDQGARLFATSHWPEKYYRAYDRATTFAKRARITASRINEFIRSKGAR